MEKQSIIPEYFKLNLEKGFTQTSVSLTHGNMKLGSRNKDFITVPNFQWYNYLHYNLSHFNKRQLFIKNLMWDILFLILTHFRKNDISLKLVSFQISQLATDDS